MTHRESARCPSTIRQSRAPTKTETRGVARRIRGYVWVGPDLCRGHRAGRAEPLAGQHREDRADIQNFTFGAFPRSLGPPLAATQVLGFYFSD